MTYNKDELRITVILYHQNEVKKNWEEIIIILQFINKFNHDKSLSLLPDISKWNTNNITDMSYMFVNCKSLSSLPDISKWNTNNVKNMSNIFSYCESLSSLPDISKWNAKNGYEIF